VVLVAFWRCGACSVAAMRLEFKMSVKDVTELSRLKGSGVLGCDIHTPFTSMPSSMALIPKGTFLMR
jgi:hypothetical protein